MVFFNTEQITTKVSAHQPLQPPPALLYPLAIYLMNYAGVEFDIVRASDKLPFFSKDHTDQVQYFCAVGGMDYFLSFRPTEPLRCVSDVTVDGVNMKTGTGWSQPKRSPSYRGTRAADGSYAPLRFVENPPDEEDDDNTMLTRTGIIKFKVYERGLSRPKEKNRELKAVVMSAPSSGPALKDKKGAMMSIAGAGEPFFPSLSKNTYDEGALLAEVEIRYMSEIGLVHRRIVTYDEIPVDRGVGFADVPSATPPVKKKKKKAKKAKKKEVVKKSKKRKSSDSSIRSVSSSGGSRKKKKPRSDRQYVTSVDGDSVTSNGDGRSKTSARSDRRYV